MLVVLALLVGVSLRTRVPVAQGSGCVLRSSQRASGVCHRHAGSRQSLVRQHPWKCRLDSAEEPVRVGPASPNGFHPRPELTGLLNRARWWNNVFSDILLSLFKNAENFSEECFQSYLLKSRGLSGNLQKQQSQSSASES